MDFYKKQPVQYDNALTIFTRCKQPLLLKIQEQIREGQMCTVKENCFYYSRGGNKTGRARKGNETETD